MSGPRLDFPFDRSNAWYLGCLDHLLKASLFLRFLVSVPVLSVCAAREQVIILEYASFEHFSVSIVKKDTFILMLFRGRYLHLLFNKALVSFDDVNDLRKSLGSRLA